MNTFLRYLVCWCIVWYIIRGIRIALSSMLEYVLGFQGTHEGVVLRESHTLYYVTDHLRMQEMCNEIMGTMPDAFHRIPDRFKTQEMCNKAIDLSFLQHVPDYFKTQEICDDVVCEGTYSLQFVPDR